MESAVTNSNKGLAIDASVIINLVATAYVDVILLALPNRVVCTSQVISEIERGRMTGRTDYQVVRELIRSGTINVESLDGPAGQVFLDLVSGSAEATLDDGEASTIALAVVQGLIPVIDERKAIRTCESRHPHMKIASTVDLLSHPSVQQALGAVRLAESIRNALELARMRVQPRNMNWVFGIIGREQAKFYRSLPYAVRNQK